MTNEYPPGQDIRLTATFADAAGTVTDPTAAVIIVKKPDDTVLAYVTSTGFSDQGAWDASANSPALADGTGTAGHYYTVSVAGTQTFGDESLTFAVGDRIYYNGKVWRQLQNVQSTNLTKDSTGVYYVDQYITNLQKVWCYSSDGVGVRAAQDSKFFVKRQCA